VMRGSLPWPAVWGGDIPRWGRPLFRIHAEKLLAPLFAPALRAPQKAGAPRRETSPPHTAFWLGDVL
jgi:hypothetical protein